MSTCLCSACPSSCFSFSAYHSDPGGQVFVFFIMLVAAAEVTVGLSILVMMKRNVDSVDVNQLNRLKG